MQRLLVVLRYSKTEAQHYEEKNIKDTVKKFDMFDVIMTCSQWVIRDFPDIKQRTITMYQYIADYFAKSKK